MLVGTLLVVGACSTQDSVDIGHSGASLVDFAAHWDGYAEAFQFDHTTSDRVRITLDAGGEGTFQVGDLPPYPPPTDFSKGYPATDRETFETGFGSGHARIRPGFQYPIHDGRIQDGRLRFSVDVSDPFDAWCKGQTPILFTDPASTPPLDQYFCVSKAATISPGPPPENCVQSDGQAESPLDCLKYRLCVDPGICACTAGGCAAAHRQMLLDELDASLDTPRTSMTGTFVLNDDTSDTGVPPRLTVKLTRQ
jgi:hypothetical protein